MIEVKAKYRGKGSVVAGTRPDGTGYRVKIDDATQEQLQTLLDAGHFMVQVQKKKKDPVKEQSTE